jgi:hypothetical protein
VLALGALYFPNPKRSDTMKLKTTKPQPEDQARMVRLYEEAMSRLHELALITERVTKAHIGLQYAVKLDSKAGAQDPQSLRDAGFRGVTYIYKDGKCVGTYDHDAGVCRAGCD